MEDIFDFDSKETLLESIKYWPFRTWRKIKDAYYEVKYFGQKIFIGHSDMQVIEMYSELAHHILPIIKDYRENKDGYPGTFSEYDDGAWQSREDYDKAIADGKMLGGGSEAWEAIVDKIIFSFEYIITEDSSPKNRKEKKMVKEFKEKYGDVWKVCPENAHENSYHLYEKDDMMMHCDNEDYIDGKHEKHLAEGWEYKGYKVRKPYHHNDELAKELEKKCNEGLELFGKWFRAFWL